MEYGLRKLGGLAEVRLAELRRAQLEGNLALPSGDGTCGSCRAEGVEKRMQLAIRKGLVMWVCPMQHQLKPLPAAEPEPLGRLSLAAEEHVLICFVRNQTYQEACHVSEKNSGGKTVTHRIASVSTVSSRFLHYSKVCQQLLARCYAHRMRGVFEASVSLFGGVPPSESAPSLQPAYLVLANLATGEVRVLPFQARPSPQETCALVCQSLEPGSVVYCDLGRGLFRDLSARFRLTDAASGPHPKMTEVFWTAARRDFGRVSGRGPERLRLFLDKLLFLRRFGGAEGLACRALREPDLSLPAHVERYPEKSI